MTNDQSERPASVVLDIPADMEQIQLARLVAAGIAARLGFDYDDIEDLRIGVDELCVALLDGAQPTGPLRLEYVPSAGEIEVCGRVRCNGVSSNGSLELGRLTEQIVGAVVDDHELRSDGEHRSFRLVKRRRPQ